MLRFKSLLLLNLMHWVIGKDYLTVSNGKIHVEKGMSCEINVNGLVIDGEGYVDGIHFGLIEYTCGDKRGSLISMAKCSDCGLYCPLNEYIEGCNHTWVLISLGAIIGMIPTLLILICLRKVICGIIRKISDNLTYSWDNFRDRVENRKVLKLSKRINDTKVVPKYKNYICTNHRLNEITRVKRGNGANVYLEVIDFKDSGVAALPSVGNNIPTAPEEYGQTPDIMKNETTPFNQSNDNNIYEPLKRVDNDQVPNPEPPKRKGSSGNLYKGAQLALMFSALLDSPSNVSGCDNTLFIFSSGKICTDVMCTEMNIYDIPVMTGSEVCFKDTDNNLMRLKVVDSYVKRGYSLMYKTSDYKIKTEQHWNCKGSGECWNGGCNPNSTHESLSYDGFHRGAGGYGCMTDGLGCDTYCHHRLACTWYSWKAVPKGQQYPVYILDSSIWGIEIEMIYKNVTSTYIFDVNNQRANLDEVGIKIPLHVSNFDSTGLSTKNGLIIVNGTGVQVDASDINMPERDKIGDYQIELYSDKFAMNTDSVTCEVSSCTAYCYKDQSRLSRLLNSPSRFTEDKVVFVNNDYRIETKTRIRSSATLKLGNVKFENLHVEKASCSVDVVTTFSCVGCKTAPYAVFQAHSIISQGLVPFISNCTFETPYLSCNSEPYKLKQVTSAKVCRLNLVTMNKTVIINFDFLFLGGLDGSKTMFSEMTSVEVLSSLIKNQEFLASIFCTFSVSTISLIIGSVIVKVFKAYMIARTADKAGMTV